MERIQPRGLPVWALLSTEHPPESPVSTPTDTVLTPSDNKPTHSHSTTPTVWATGGGVRTQDSVTPVRTPVRSRSTPINESFCRGGRGRSDFHSSKDGDSDNELDAWVHAVTGHVDL